MKTVFKIIRPARDGEMRSSLENNGNSLVLDWNYQSSAPSFRGSGTHSRTSLQGFRAISNGFSEAEAKREYRIEAAMFGIIAALAAWPMFQAAQALLVLIK